MTTVRVLRKDKDISRIEIHGHSGYAAEGEDIVCAAITSAVRYAEVILNEVLHLDVKFTANHDKAFLSFSRTSLSAYGSDATVGDAVFEGFARYMKELSAEYPDYIKVMEVQQDA
ncbi:MAG: ribosomal-processing cysteine protease Prp [Clostridiales bacterium]|nr:ribosomal-processing cysteine protease Prp [Clostridiales bacterium]